MIADYDIDVLPDKREKKGAQSIIRAYIQAKQA